MNRLARRDFLKSGALLGAAALTGDAFSTSIVRARPTGSAGPPIVITSANGVQAAGKAMELIQQGSDALDAVIAGVNIVEDDPNDNSVGYGGLPNEDGVVELDAAVMHGPTYRAGAVASIRNIKNPSRVARMVMDRSDHVLLVGEGALRFAKAHGFPEENLLTDASRAAWLKWKEELTNQDDWLPPHTIDDADIGALYQANEQHYGTIHMSALDKQGNLSCTTTTSGLAFKIAGRVGDSPILGAGLYCDNEVGSAGSTGRGEANLLNCSSVMVVEWMRQGKSPEEACILACKRIAERQREKRLQDKEGRFKYNVKFYAINRRGQYGGASIWSGTKFVVHDGTSVKTLDSAYLYKSP